MTPLLTKTDIIKQLQKVIISMQGGAMSGNSQRLITGLGPIEQAFPNRSFPTGAIHELISHTREDAAPTNGFIAGLLSPLMRKDGICLWVSNKRTIFPPALKLMGIEPDKVIFIDLTKPKDVLWVIEEGLKCNAVAAVVGELQELSFTESRRLQLAVEESRVTGFIHRHQPRSENAVACVARWKITSLPGITTGGLPGVGHPRWNIQLAKARNGKPGMWQVEWADNSFRFISRNIALPEIQTLKAG